MLHVKNTQLHHERANTKPYDKADHRVHHEDCSHSRFFDLDYPALTKGRCLDCGAVIALGTWVVLDEPHATDDHLASERVRFNEFWGDNLKPTD